MVDVHKRFKDSELVIGLVGAVGADLAQVERAIASRLDAFGYSVESVRISDEIIPQVGSTGIQATGLHESQRLNSLMDAGNAARENSKDNSILALGAASWIASSREGDESGDPKSRLRTAYIVRSLKRPEEVAALRSIYPQGFYLFGVYADEKRRLRRLVEEKQIDESDAKKLIDRDADENVEFGQRVTDTFHLSDFFINVSGGQDECQQSVWRVLDLLFGDPYITPMFHEYAMFLAFAAALRSADLSRQVGAVVAKEGEIIGTGANDVPRYGGGLYWPDYDEEEKRFMDVKDGRDYTRGRDENRFEKSRMIKEIVDNAEKEGLDRVALWNILEQSRIMDLTEFGRSVHAEMESLLCCARSGINVKDATLYCTTFPCHNCAKHIVAAGIKEVVYVEPYEKSRALDFHQDSTVFGSDDEGRKVQFLPFVGVGPRRFVDLFSVSLGSGTEVRRKESSSGETVEWRRSEASLRLQMRPFTYLDTEIVATEVFKSAMEEKEGQDD